MCGIFGIYGHKDAARLTYLGLYALQHRGEESAGIVVYNGEKVKSHNGMGLVSDVFDEKIIKSLHGNVAVGHVRYSTTGSSISKNIQPFLVAHRKGHIAIAHNGNLVNTLQLRREMEEKGSVFQTTMDSEIIVHLIVLPTFRRNVVGRTYPPILISDPEKFEEFPGPKSLKLQNAISRGKSRGIAKLENEDMQQKVIDALSQLQGAYSIVLMLNDTLIGARDPYGFRPLCIGKLGESYILASETCALDLIQAEYVRDVEPGEIVFIDSKGLRSIKPLPKKRHAFCIFEYIYFSRPDSNIFGKNVYLTRKQLGKQLAREYPANCDLVMPIPDSGNYAALGFAEETKIPYEIGMIRNHYIGRTFIQPSQFIRDFRVKVKLNPIKDAIKDKSIVLVEDSIVRGTTSKARVKTLREAGAKEIHMRISCPPIRFPCFYGIDFPTKRELIANNRTVDSIKDFIGLDSLKYLSLEGMLKSMLLPKDEFCTACFTGNYPTKLSKKISKNMLEKNC